MNKNNGTHAAESNGHKRAAIYVRVSSEAQAEKASPEIQESDCRDYCKSRGYAVGEVYRDTEKYRVGRRMVEPSGTRADRPQLRRMLADAHAGKFEVIIGWREDRLYRSYRPMLDVLDCLEATEIEIELAKETFDRKLAPVKAWAARMELDAKHDRMMMGIAGRLAKGKPWNNHVHYGYRIEEGVYLADPEESKWVVKIWKWCAEGLTPRAIRERLIKAGAPQRATNGNHPAWQTANIRHILRTECYHTGLTRESCRGKMYEIQTPILIDAELAQRVAEQRRRRASHPARNVKFEYLASGKVYCAACKVKVKMSTITTYAGGKPRKTPSARVRCTYGYGGENYNIPGCFGGANLRKIESDIWNKTWTLISDDEVFTSLVETRVEFLRSQEIDAGAEVERLKGALADLTLERQKVNTKWRKGGLSEADRDEQIAEVEAEALDLSRELQEKSLLVGNRATRLMELANDVRGELREGAEWLNGTPKTAAGMRKQFELRRRVLDEIVERVDVQADKSVKVQFVFDLSDVVGNCDAPTRWPAGPRGL